jgi:hypothetical protein
MTLALSRSHWNSRGSTPLTLMSRPQGNRNTQTMRGDAFARRIIRDTSRFPRHAGTKSDVPLGLSVTRVSRPSD